MLVKCETKSKRVKGISFHPQVSWILASLHDGTIQLWDYRIGTLIDTFDEHKGPVRSVDFHNSQPLFVSGGDDHSVRLWNYRQRRCLCVFTSHMDYIRVVKFHSEYPWILSASDDQTIRIWNWQSRICIAVLTGHNHFIMSAQFHPTQDLLVSGSLDQTLRVWSVAGLREKTVSLSENNIISSQTNLSNNNTQHNNINNLHTTTTTHNTHNNIHNTHIHTHLFGTTDAICKFVLEGHESGINTVVFHSTMPFIASGSDDRMIKLWRYNETTAWEIDTLRGHVNNISSIAFHPNYELLLSNSEDRTIRVWDIAQRICVHTYRRETERFWALSVDINSNLIAVGHDSGMVVFKMNRERPPFDILNNNFILYIKNGCVIIYDLHTTNTTNYITTRKPLNAMSQGPKDIYINNFNTDELNFLLIYQEGDHCSYDLIISENIKSLSNIRHKNHQQIKTETCFSVAFISRNRYVVLEKRNSLTVCTLKNEINKKIDLPFFVDKLFPATNNKILLKNDETIYLYDMISRCTVGEVVVPGSAKNVIWSENEQICAILSKHNILLTNNKMCIYTSIHESLRVKSGAFDEHGVFIYTTTNHLKYCMQNGDNGIIQSLSKPIYIIKINQRNLIYIDRSGDVRTLELSSEEFLFKLALQKNQIDQVALLIQNGRLFGNSIVGYLKKKGFPDVAMQFVDDVHTRFNLSLESGDLKEAFECATKLNEKHIWKSLGEEGITQGNHHLMEICSQKIHNYEILTFLYVICGNIIKLNKMLAIAQAREDLLQRLQNSFYLGNITERVIVLAAAGHLPLAALISKINKLHKFSSKLNEITKFDENYIYTNKKHPKLFTAPLPIYPTNNMTNWPLLPNYKPAFNSAMQAVSTLPANIVQSYIDKSMNISEREKEIENLDEIYKNDENDDFNENNNNNLLLNDIYNNNNNNNNNNINDDDDDINIYTNTAWSDIEDIGEINLISPSIPIKQTQGSNKIYEEPIQNKWLSVQPMIADLVAAGLFVDVLKALHIRIGIVYYIPLYVHIIYIYQSTYIYINGFPMISHLHIPIIQNGALTHTNLTPHRLYNKQIVLKNIKKANKLFIAGSFEECLDAFREVLYILPFVVAKDENEDKQLREWLEYCCVYITAVRIELNRKSISGDDIKRNIELACYFACCSLQPPHRIFSLKKAIAICFKAKNFKTASFFGKQFLKIDITKYKLDDEITKIKQILTFCEQNNLMEKYQIDFEHTDYDNLKLCTSSLTKIHNYEQTVCCPYTQSLAKMNYNGEICKTTNITQLGLSALGIQFLPSV